MNGKYDSFLGQNLVVIGLDLLRTRHSIINKFLKDSIKLNKRGRKPDTSSPKSVVICNG